MLRREFESLVNEKIEEGKFMDQMDEVLQEKFPGHVLVDWELADYENSFLLQVKIKHETWVKEVEFVVIGSEIMADSLIVSVIGRRDDV